jgi:hypothetical protein
VNNLPFNETTTKLLSEDRDLLTNTKFPIVTVSASFRDEVEKYHKLEDMVNHPDVVFSRAHFSMAVGVAVAAWKDGLDWKKAWLVDPSNYVTKKDLRNLATSQVAGRLMARNKALQWVKENIVDRYGRKKLPITDAITPPLIYLTQNIERPIISMHIVAGNALAPLGKKIVQVVTDPHVRPDYVSNAQLPNMRFCVFDETTKESFLEVALAEGKVVDPSHIIVTGPPIDPRVIEAKERKTAQSWKRRPIRLLLTTGGLGTNKGELEQLLEGLLPALRRRKQNIQILYYAGTNQDHVKMVEALAKKHHVSLGQNKDRLAKLRILYADDVVTSNELLIKYGFPWADIVYTKPSGDMAYDAVAAGCALLLLEPWGEWERNIQSIFQKLALAVEAKTENPLEQLETLTVGSAPWLTSALEKTRLLPPNYSRGAQNILNVAKNWQ